MTEGASLEECRESLVDSLREMSLAQGEIGTEIAVSDENEYESIRGSAWFESLQAEVTPGATLKVYRGNAGLSQTRLSELTGIPVPHLSGMEHDRRPIGKASARKLAGALAIDYRRLL